MTGWWRTLSAKVRPPKVSLVKRPVEMHHEGARESDTEVWQWITAEMAAIPAGRDPALTPMWWETPVDEDEPAPLFDAAPYPTLGFDERDLSATYAWNRLDLIRKLRERNRAGRGEAA